MAGSPTKTTSTPTTVMSMMPAPTTRFATMAAHFTYLHCIIYPHRMFPVRTGIHITSIAISRLSVTVERLLTILVADFTPATSPASKNRICLPATALRAPLVRTERVIAVRKASPPPMGRSLLSNLRTLFLSLFYSWSSEKQHLAIPFSIMEIDDGLT